MSTPSTSTTIDATAAVPIDVASKLLLGARHAYRRADRQLRLDAQRARVWLDRQNPEQVMQVSVLMIYGLVAVIEAVAYKRKGR